MNDAELLALHRALVGIPSVSRAERELTDWLVRWLQARGVEPVRVGDSLIVDGRQSHREGPLLCLNSHLDTVPAAPGWTRPPHEAAVVDGRVYGLGSNDAKASVAAMIAAFLRLRARGEPLGARVMLALAVEEETGGKGTEALLAELRRRDLWPEAAVVGEPTGLDVAVAQKGLVVLELREQGKACHAAHARALGAPNAIRQLARDLVALESVDLGPAHPLLGPVTLEPTVATAGTARNVVPGEASCILDLRSNPGRETAAAIERLRAAVSGRLRVVSDRLRPSQLDPSSPLVQAALAARPNAALFGSRGVSDLVFFAAAGVPCVKVGPGQTERSHTPDEYVGEEEVVAGARFYEALALAWAARAAKREGADEPAVGSR